MQHLALQVRYSHFCLAFVLTITFLLSSSFSFGQAAAPNTAAPPELQDLTKYPGLLPELGKLFEQLQRNVQLPPDRIQSDLLPLLPADTNLYFAMPNYGEASHQVLKIFRQQLQQNSALREWWTQGKIAESGPKIEDALDKFYGISQFLGNEIVISGAADGKQPHLLIVAEVRKPGLKPYLQQMLSELTKPQSPLRVFDPQGLAKAKQNASDSLLVLVRPDLVAASGDLATLRDFDSRIAQHSTAGFPSTPFGRRIEQAYPGGVSVVGAADLQRIIAALPAPKAQANQILQATGFSDVKYMIWEHHNFGGHAISQSELSFTAPRHGVAGWLAAPAHLGSLEYVSPKAIMSASLMLKNPADIFDEVETLAAGSNPAAAAQLAQTEQALGINLRDDLFGQLTGEITVELDNLAPPQPTWKVILRVKDSDRLQRTIAQLLTATHARMEQVEEGQLRYYVVQSPSSQASTIAYAFQGDYLIFASSPAGLTQAVSLHAKGESLAKSRKFLAALPPGHADGVSGLIYQNPVAMNALRLQKLAPGLATSFAQLSEESTPAVVCLYGDETTIRSASTSPAFDVGAVLVVAAIAIPNLLRSRIAANEASAVGRIRTMTTAEITYASTYPNRGFASHLAMLSARGANVPPSADHAGLLDPSFAKPTCTGRQWCEDSGYRFIIKGACAFQRCQNFVAAATPTDSNASGKSFCSTSDGVVRFKGGPALMVPPTVLECHRWQPLR